jgi:hypothetical protein
MDRDQRRRGGPGPLHGHPRHAAWNDRRYDWKQRGTEQAAEIVTWGLGEGEIAPLLSTRVDAETLASLYVLLTGHAPITLAAAG